MDLSHSASPEAEALFLQYLERREAGESIDFETWCDQHSGLASELGHLEEVRRWLESLTLSAVEPWEAEGTRVAATPPGWTPAETGTQPSSSASTELVARLHQRTPESARYHFRGQVGRGGMATVLRVHDSELNRVLAMKIADGQDPESGRRLEGVALARFLEEARITSQLEHPGIVPVHELGVDEEGRLYFTMRLVEGESLAEWLERGEPDRTQAIRVLLKVCEAVSYAHEKGVLHRDLKPSNIMLGAFGEAYVMDWGLAKVLGIPAATDSRDQASERHGLDSSGLRTQSGFVVGTPVYMSPEQARGHAVPASDVYSVGAILYRVLSGYPPYGSPAERREHPATGRAVLRRLNAGPPQPLHRLAPDADPELVSICERAMQRDPHARYFSIQDLAEDLRAFLEGRVVRAHGRGAWAELKKWTHRNRALAAALSGLFLSLVAGLCTSTWLLVEARVSSRRADREARMSDEVTRFLRGMFDEGTPNQARGERVLVRDVLERQAQRVLAMEDAEPSVRSELALSLAQAQGDLGLWRDALPLLGLIRELQPRREPGSDAEFELLRIKYAIQAGEHGQAEELLDSLEEEFRALAEREPVTWYHLLGRRGQLRVAQGRLGEAEPLLREARAGLEALDSGQVYPSLLGDLLRRLGRYEEAEEVFLEQVEQNLLEEGPEHSSTLRNEHSLATIYLSQGKREQAGELLDAVVEKAQRVMGREHPLTLSIQNNRARLKFEEGELEAAHAILSENLARARRRLGQQDEVTLLLVQNSAAVARRLGNPELAEQLYREALAGYGTERSEDHPRLLGLQSNLALVLAGDEQRWGEAEVLYLESLEGRRALLGASHPDTCNTQVNLARLFQRQGQVGAAVELLVPVLGFARDRGAWSPVAQRARRSLIETLCPKAEGRRKLEEHAREGLLGADPLQEWAGLAELWVGAGFTEEAAALYARLLDEAPAEDPRQEEWASRWERLEFGS